MLRMHYVVGVSQVWYKSAVDCMRNVNNVQKSAMVKIWKKWSRSPPNVNRIPCSCLPSLIDVRFWVRQLSCWRNDKQNDHITSASLAEVTNCGTTKAPVASINFNEECFPGVGVHELRNIRDTGMAAGLQAYISPGGIFKGVHGEETSGTPVVAFTARPRRQTNEQTDKQTNRWTASWRKASALRHGLSE